MLEGDVEIVFTGRQFLGLRALPQPQEDRRRGQREEDRGEDERAAHHEDIAIGHQDWRENQQQDDDPARRADRPTRPGDASHFRGRGDLGQQRVVEDLRGAISDLGQQEESDCQRNRPAFREEKQGGEQHRKRGEEKEEPFFRAGVIGNRPHDRRRDGDDDHRGRDGQSPQPRTFRAADHLLLKVRRIDCEQDHGGVCRVPKIIQVPGHALASRGYRLRCDVCHLPSLLIVQISPAKFH